MTVAVNTASGTKTVGKIHVNTASGTKTVANGYVRTADGLEAFYQSLASGGSGGSSAITVSPAGAGGGASSSSSITVYSSYVTVTPSGGTAPYSYSWSKVSGDAITANAPTSATTNFSANLAPGDFLSAVFKCAVTDAAGVSADSPTVNVTLRNLGGSL